MTMLTHAFASPKAASADATKVDGPKWNADHVFTGFVDGNLLYYDSTQPSKASWSDGMMYRPKGLFIQAPSGPCLILQSGDPAEGNSQSPLVIARGADATVCTTFIDAFGAFNTLAAIRCLGNFANLGTIAADGTFTPVSTAGSGVSCMIDVVSDTTVGVVIKTAPGGSFYALQALDSTGKFVFSIKEDGTHSWGVGANHAAEDTTLGRTAAGKLAVTGTTPMFQLGGTTNAFPAWKSSGATMMCRLADDSGYAELDVATIHPAATFDFRLKQNSVDVLFSKEATAVNSTLWLEAGKVGITTALAPAAKLHVTDGAGNFLAGNNSFGSDWIVLTDDIALGTTNFFLAVSAASGVVLNARSTKSVFIKAGNAGGVTITASAFDAPAYKVGGTSGIDTTITTASLVGKTVTISKGLITGFA